MKITLPKPPPTNHLYAISCRSGRALMYKTQRGKDWIEECLWLIKSQWRKKTITCDVGIYIVAYICGRGDIYNVVKPILDVLQEGNVIENDNQVDFLQVRKEKVKHKKQEKIEVELSV
jgi:Holliday junction resolvase RusA-like endonuclease